MNPYGPKKIKNVLLLFYLGEFTKVTGAALIQIIIIIIRSDGNDSPKTQK